MAGFGSLDVPSTSFGDMSLSGDKLEEEEIVFAKKSRGTQGRPVDLFVNFFQISLTQNTPQYYHYNIEIIEDPGSSSGETSGPSSSKGGAVIKGGKKGRHAAQAKQEAQQQYQQQPSQQRSSQTPRSKRSPKRLNDEIFRKIFDTHRNVFQTKVIPVFDGEKNFYSTTQFRLPNRQWSGTVQVMDKEKQITIRVNITEPQSSHLQNLTRLLTPACKKEIMPIELQALDIIMRNGSRLVKTVLGSNFFLKARDPNWKLYGFYIGDDRVKYGQFGHYQCAKMTESGLYYNVDRAMAVFSEGGKLSQLLKDVVNRDVLNLKDIQRCEEDFKSLKFSTLHLSYKRTFIIAGFSRNDITKTTFKQSDGTVVSVYDYFNAEYKNFVQRYPLNKNWPCVQVGSRNNARYFPIETCDLEYDEVYRRKLNPKLQGMFTRTSSQQKPFDRFDGIEKHIQSIERDSVVNGIDYLKHFGIGIAKTKKTIKGRVLNAPLIEYHGDKKVDTSGQGQWDMRGRKFFEPSDIGKYWAVVNIGKIRGAPVRSSIYKNKVDELVASLIKGSKSNGINLSAPSRTEYDFDYQRGCMVELFKRMKDMKLVIIIIPNRDEIYNEIKSVSELQDGIITQCLNQEKPYWKDPLTPQLITNFFLKINPKTQGTNQTIPWNARPPILRSKLMFIGLDVTHPSPTDGLSKSVAACVGTYTKHYDKCHHKIVIQEKARKEVVSLKEIVKYLLKKFKAFNEFYPDRIIVYRDGIGEGDFEKIIRIELASVYAAYRELAGSDVKATYIMVQKRHNTRFMPTKMRKDDRRQNVEPGTVVDSVITHHKFFEFYLCSHLGMMGTSRPTKYVVLHDDNDLDADHIQAATYFTCYLYPRCTKSSSIPPFVQYSHLLAKRGRAYLAHAEMDSDSRSSVGSGGRLPVLSAAEINQINQSIAVPEKVNGILFFI